jgi:predicted DNA repair protein MutK
MAIALAELGALGIAEHRAVLAMVGSAPTGGAYGVVGAVASADDIGLHLVQRRAAASRAVGRGLVEGVPKLLKLLSAVGTAALLWVGGGILLHGIEDLGLERFPHAVEDLAVAIAHQFGPLKAIMDWLANALAAAIFGLLIGIVLVAIVRQFTRHPEELIVD